MKTLKGNYRNILTNPQNNSNIYNVTVAQTAGFCSGVKRAMKIALTAAEKYGRAYTIGRLVHNNDAIRILEQNNVFSVETPDDLPENSAAVIRSHGVGRNIYDKLINHVCEDATCAYVKKIHRLVQGQPAVIVAGDKSHPEVIGITGHITGEYFIINSAGELQDLLIHQENLRHNALIMVAQTTFNEQKWLHCTEILKKHCTNAKIFDTICNATIKRQTEARELSRKSDFMIVIGSSQSSNSVKLYEICKENCPNTFFIENSKALTELLRQQKSPPKAASITAGASVPAEIIKEVHNIMNTELNSAETKTVNLNQENEIKESGEFDFMAEVDKTFPAKIYTGKRVKAYVVAVNKTEVVVDLGTKHSGYIPADEVGGSPGSTPDMILKAGDEIECIVTKVNDAEGVVYLSKKRIDSELGFEKLIAAHNDSEVLEGHVISVVNGGVIVTYEGTRVFVPASQSGVPKTGKLEELLKKAVKFKVIEVNEQRNRVVGSIKAASRLENDAIRKKFWDEIEIGKKYTGEIKSMESYGIFVDLGGVDGMVHLSELTWQRVKHPKEIVAIGEKLEVFVKNFDPDKRRVSLCAKDPGDNPWTKFMNENSVGDTVKATIVNITPFGAFAQISAGIDGLIHISQISRDRVKNVNQSLEVGQEVDVKITEIDAEKERVSISIKALLEPESEPQTEESEAELETQPEEDSPADVTNVTEQTESEE